MDDLYRYVYWLSGNRAIANDLVQDTLVRAWKAMNTLQDEKAVKGWLQTILRRDNARRFARKRPLESEMPTEEVAADRKDFDIDRLHNKRGAAVPEIGRPDGFPDLNASIGNLQNSALSGRLQ